MKPDAAFLFVVRRIRFLARVPLLPHLFEAVLVAWTALTCRERLAAIETLEKMMRAQPGVELRPHRLGGTEFRRAGRELGHVHGHGLVDIHLSREEAQRLVDRGFARAHHIFPIASGWVSYPLNNIADAARARDLLSSAP